jgi:FkbH-like protein
VLPAKVKCLVWDLDDTLWDGVVIEGDRPQPFPVAVDVLHRLDKRGILHAVASRSDHDLAVGQLSAHGLDEMFCAAEIGWNAKSAAVRRIAETLNIGLDTLAFVDNDPAELAEVAHELPMVRCFPAERLGSLPELADFQPGFVTEESGQRRHMYRADRLRKQAEQEFGESSAEFLASLDMVMTVAAATESDLARAHELTVRTHQLNTTGQTFGMDELRELCASPSHQVLVARLADRFGSHGTIGLAVTELADPDSVLKLLLMSCRVMSRGAGTALLGHLVSSAVHSGLRPVAHFVPTDVNRVMLITLRFAGYEVVEQRPDRLVLAVDPAKVPEPHGHVRIVSAVSDSDGRVSHV